MKKLYMLCSAVLLLCNAHAQLLTVGPGGSVTIKNGTLFYVDGLTLIPSVDFTLSDVNLNKSATAVHIPVNTYISRVYQFSNTTDPFTGSVQMNYTDGAELNGIPENVLTLNIYNGTNWAPYPPLTRDATNNFVLTNGINNVTLNELTLANQQAPLPLTWLSFTAKAQNNSHSLLQWATAQEQNTNNFYIQHSADGINWVTLGSLPAAGNSNNTIQYNYVHTNPVIGLNYYRIKQTDIDSRYSYSAVRTVLFTSVLQPFAILGNPVTHGKLLVQVYTATQLILYTADGKLLWQQQVNTGINTIDVSRYAKGTYLLRSVDQIQKVIIQ